MQLYEVALAEGETSRDLIARARELGMGRLSATTELSADQIQRLCPRSAASGPQRPPTPRVIVGSAAIVVTDDDDASPPQGPRMGLVAAVLLVALAAVSLGIGILGGGSSDRDETAAAAAVRPAPTSGAGAEGGLELVDAGALCRGWPIVRTYWAEFGAALDRSADVEDLSGWAAEHHRAAAVALRDEIGPAFDRGATEVQDVLRWVFDTAYPADDWDLGQVRVATDAAATSVAALAQAATAAAC